jgi:ribonuclease-3
MTAEAALSRTLGYIFAQPDLLLQALTHRSRSAINNERLEFLGDSILNCVVASLLYQRFPQQTEGDLSRLRAHLVKESMLSDLAVALNLGSHLRLGDGELKSSGWRRPSVLADTMEAIIGATYLDGGFAAAEALVSRLYSPVLDNLDPNSIGKDPKTLLQEYLQGRKLGLPEYAVIATEGEAHCQTFCVECHIPPLSVRTRGEGGSRRAAEQQAASRAYQLATNG